MKFRLSRRIAGVERTLIRQIFDAAPPDAVNLGLGQPDLKTPAFAADDGIRAIREGRTGYTTTAGVPALRAAIASRYPKHVDGPDQVVVTVGSQEAMFAACMTLLDPGDELLIPEPGYPAYPVLAQLAGATAVRYRLDPANRFRIDPLEVERKISDRTRAVIVCEPSNPTGAYSGRPQLQALADLLRRRGIPWISDEIYSAYDYRGEWVSLTELAPGRGLVISSLSKDLSMTGWRLGWVAGPRSIADKLAAMHQYLVTCNSSISQAAAERAFGPDGDRARAEFLAIFADRRERLSKALSKIPGLVVHPPDGAFYFFVDVRPFGECMEIARVILERENVIVIPGIAFGEAGRGFLRISFAAPSDVLERAAAGIGRVLASFA